MQSPPGSEQVRAFLPAGLLPPIGSCSPEIHSATQPIHLIILPQNSSRLHRHHASLKNIPAPPLGSIFWFTTSEEDFCFPESQRLDLGTKGPTNLSKETLLDLKTWQSPEPSITSARRQDRKQKTKEQLLAPPISRTPFKLKSVLVRL